MFVSDVKWRRQCLFFISGCAYWKLSIDHCHLDGLIFECYPFAQDMNDAYMKMECSLASAQYNTWHLREAAAKTRVAFFYHCKYIMCSQPFKRPFSHPSEVWTIILHEASCKAHFKQTQSVINKATMQCLSTISCQGNLAPEETHFPLDQHKMKQSKNRSGYNSPGCSEHCVCCCLLPKKTLK